MSVTHVLIAARRRGRQKSDVQHVTGSGSWTRARSIAEQQTSGDEMTDMERDDTVERVARAIRLAYCGKGAAGAWEKMSDDLKLTWREQARAAIAALPHLEAVDLLNEEIVHLRAELDAMPGWQPIEDVPLNTPILILLDEPHRQKVGRGFAPSVCVVVGDVQEADNPFILGPDGSTALAIRWQPLPPPPKDSP